MDANFLREIWHEGVAANAFLIGNNIWEITGWRVDREHPIVEFSMRDGNRMSVDAAIVDGVRYRVEGDV